MLNVAAGIPSPGNSLMVKSNCGCAAPVGHRASVTAAMRLKNLTKTGVGLTPPGLGTNWAPCFTSTFCSAPL